MAYQFQESIQKGILYLVKSDQDFLVQSMPMIKAEYFEFPSHQKMYTVITNHYEAYKNLPSDDQILEGIKDIKTSNELMGDYRDEIDSINSLDTSAIDNSSYLLDKVEDFAKSEAMKSAILNSIEVLKQPKPNFSQIESELRGALSINRNVDLGIDYFTDIEERWERITSESVAAEFRTPFETINRELEGGLAAKEMAMVVAPPGVGKSLFLANQAVRSCMDGKNVLYVSLEMSEDRVAQRLDSIFTRIEQRQLKSRIDDLKQRLDTVSTQISNRGKLIIKEFPTKRCTVSNLRAFLNQLSNYSDFVPDVIIIDYLELMSTDGQAKEYQAQERCAQELRGLATEYKCLVWTATQTNREGKKVNLITDAELADSYGKIRVCDLAFSINQSEQEFDEKKARLYLMKSRNGRARFCVNVKIDYDRLVISEDA